MSRARKRGWLLLMLALLLTAAASVGLLWRWFNAPVVTAQTFFMVPQGASVSRIAQLLEQQAGLQHPRLWSLWVRYQQLGSRMKAGEYLLETGMTPKQLVQLLSNGAVLLRSLTVVEGSTFAELRRLLAARDDLTQTLKGMSDEQLLRTLAVPNDHPEGWFFPDTYRFARGARDIDILRMAHQRMNKELTAAWAQRDPALPLSSPYEALIMASIVEKESALASERPRIAGVFVTRLKRNMRLQTDPTIIYGLGSQYDGNLRKVDMQRDTPYNTYTRDGLPPTPICLPGAGALRATVRPVLSNEIYFMATGLGDGSHYFSSNYADHQAAWRRYMQTTRQQR